ncbi:MAG: hypothetical protein COZ96_02200 [Nitrospirae bacterium CG_4_8_14_3_um_filter_70_85]|nr:MAG: hypothetical protein COZ96_02200 [Nitrospirae bacterium CG_4_8_14_3_um_filter_70_85]
MPSFLLPPSSFLLPPSEVSPTVVITRPGPKARILTAGLEERGARLIPFPVLAIAPPADPAPLDEACSALATFDWLLLTSANGVSAVAERVEAWPAEGPRIAVVGEQTAAAVQRLGWPVEVLPEQANAEGLLAELVRRGPVAGRRFLFPRAEAGREILVESLRAAGGEVKLVVAYRALAVDHPAAEVTATFAHTRVDLVTFTSGACAENFLAILGNAGLASRARGWPAAVIGPVTAQACTTLGLPVVAIAAEPSPAALLAAAASYLWPEARG